ncbi:hypothetical protein BN1723_005661 [Verticillium longisporum]|uniref:BZIP domain-containing protein n=1 Tax=Verticillium longisporum TaxID=100787 RepID=A0A0G4NAP2_VERLO|nr:hypothetical protein BN1723_005661 [Verticillium longisporum]
MESWEHSATPMIKFEDSPAESFVSTPGDMYPSLFPESASPNTLDPSDMMSPSSPQDLTIADTDMPLSEASAGDKKGSKKRKSWGQVLPEPKTNLPPRKRAKTEDEKEQRRVERVLRNRRAAQSSRERKRLEVEALEMKNKELETALNHAQQANARLMEELTKFRRGSGAVARSSSPFDSFHNSNSVTLSPELFGSQDGRRPSVADSESTLVDGLMAASKSAATVNPASLSPALTPVPETDETSAQQEAAVAAPSPVALSSDVTQLVGGLADFPAPNMDFVPSASDAHDHFLGGHFSVSEAFDADRYVLESGLLSSPNSVDYDNDIMAGDSSAFASAFNFDMDEFLNDEASAAATDASAAENSAADPDYGRRAPNPETQALRLASEGCENRVGGTDVGAPVTRDSSREPHTWFNGGALPSKEVLLTLLWTLRVEERKMIQQGILPNLHPETNTHTSASLFNSTTTTSVKKRQGDALVDGGEKRVRFR